MCYEFGSDVAIMTITNKKTIPPHSFGIRIRFKTSLEPIQTVFITHPPFFVAINRPYAKNTRRNPLSGYIFGFENDERWHNFSVNANAFHHLNPLLTTRLCLKL